MKIALGNDHIGLSFISELNIHLNKKGLETIHYGVFNDERMNYPDIAFKVSEVVAEGHCQQGILICGTGIGMSLAANKVYGIRAAVCSEPYSAKMAKCHNNANILCLGSRVVGVEMAKMIIDSWLSAKFENGRHNKRVEMINNYKK